MTNETKTKDENRDDPLAVALRGKILELAAKPLTTSSTRQIAQFTLRASKLLASLKRGPEGPPKKAPQSPWVALGAANGQENMDAELGADDAGGDDIPADYPGGPMLMGSNPFGQSETWAATMVRQLIGVWKDEKESARNSPERIVEAIVAARSAGATDLAERLEARLFAATAGDVGVTVKGESRMVRMPSPAKPVEVELVVPTDAQVEETLAKKRELISDLRSGRLGIVPPAQATLLEPDADAVNSEFAEAAASSEPVEAATVPGEMQRHQIDPWDVD